MTSIDEPSPQKILIVDDDPVNRLIAKKKLKQRRNSIIEEAEDGEEAVRKSSQNNIDIVVMDIEMPGINGIEAALKIRKSSRDRGVKEPIIIANTTNWSDDMKQRCKEAEFDGFVEKGNSKNNDINVEIEKVIKNY